MSEENKKICKNCGRELAGGFTMLNEKKVYLHRETTKYWGRNDNYYCFSINRSRRTSPVAEPMEEIQ